jgi:hypothetical protein
MSLQTITDIIYEHGHNIQTALKGLTALILVSIPTDYIVELFSHKPSDVFVEWMKVAVLVFTILNIIWNMFNGGKKK